MSINLGISEKSLKEVSGALNHLLADEFALYTKTRKYHWNVMSTDFGELHKFFEDQYIQISDFVDQVAERVLQLGQTAWGTLEEFSQTRLKEEPGVNPMAQEMLSNLLSDHESIIRTLRKDQEAANEAGDQGTNNFLVDLMSRHEKMAWMLRSYLSRHTSDRRDSPREKSENVRQARIG